MSNTSPDVVTNYPPVCLNNSIMDMKVQKINVLAQHNYTNKLLLLVSLHTHNTGMGSSQVPNKMAGLNVYKSSVAIIQ